MVYPGSVSSASKMYIPTTFLGIPLYGPGIGGSVLGEGRVSSVFLFTAPVPLTALREGQ